MLIILLYLHWYVGLIHFQHSVNAVNTMLMNRCKNCGLGYVNNSNIEVGILAQDELHLNEISKSCLANNFINFINRYILWYEEACNDSDNCLSNAAQENYIDPKENKPVNSSNIQEENSLDSLRKLRLRNVNKVIIGNININSLPAKFDQVKEVILKNVDILVITETKLDDTFPLGQFYVEGFTMPYRPDRSCIGGGVITNNSSYFKNTKTFFTGLSDFHKLVTTALKMSIPKNKPLQINYRNYKHFNNDSFNEDLN